MKQSFQFTERIVCICGRNGMGKTNLLDAVYYLGFTKSYFTRMDALNVHQGAIGFRLEGNCTIENEESTLVCVLRETGKKEFLVNNTPYAKLADHIGRYPSVMISPDDIKIITEGSEERRRYIDTLLSQLDAEYLRHLIEYNKILQQRNGYLKLLSESRSSDLTLLDVYDKQLAVHGEYIFSSRKKYILQLIPMILESYIRIAGSNEHLELKYESQLSNYSFAQLLQKNREKDIASVRSNAGIHKDDLSVLLNERPFKYIASQGQRKSFLFGLKLSEFEMLATSKGFAPLLLLDDVFEKLDEHRMHNLLHRVCLEQNGQVFITDTHCERIKDQFAKLKIGYQLIEL